MVHLIYTLAWLYFENIIPEKCNGQCVKGMLALFFSIDIKQ